MRWGTENNLEAQKTDQKTSARILSTSIVNMCFDFLHHQPLVQNAEIHDEYMKQSILLRKGVGVGTGVGDILLCVQPFPI